MKGDSGTRRADDALCEVEWSDLVARLSAAREMRGQVEQEESESLASFDAHSARHLAAHGDGDAVSDALRNQEQRPVNPDGLGNRKDASANSIDHDHGSAAADRGSI
ncbi:hypothetical protein BMF35_a0743 [Aurantiacibacter gangjinensis]|nr:hypothetical protein BMF35_a0743 [Aurantiacibacter gangjinensis]